MYFELLHFTSLLQIKIDAPPSNGRLMNMRGTITPASIPEQTV